MIRDTPAFAERTDVDACRRNCIVVAAGGLVARPGPQSTGLRSLVSWRRPPPGSSLASRSLISRRNFPRSHASTYRRAIRPRRYLRPAQPRGPESSSARRPSRTMVTQGQERAVRTRPIQITQRLCSDCARADAGADQVCGGLCQPTRVVQPHSAEP